MAAASLGMKKLISVLAVTALVAAACGDSDSGDSPQTTAPEVATTSAAPTTAAPPVTTTTTRAPTTTSSTTTTTTTSTTTTTLAPHPGVVGEIVLGSKPCALEVGSDGTAWVTMIGSRDLVEIDPATGELLDSVSPGNGACGVAITDGLIWVADTVTNSVFWLDEETLAFQDRLSLDGPPWDLQTDGELVWVVVRAPGRVLAIDPATAEVVLDVVPGLGQMTGLALTEGAAWAAAELSNVVLRIDAATGDVTEIPVDGTPSWFGEADDAVWVSQATSGQVSKIDAATSEIVLTVDVGAQPLDLTVAFGSVWVPNRADGTLTRIDEATGEVIDTIGLVDGVWVAEPVGDEVWVTDFTGNTIFRIDPTISG